MGYPVSSEKKLKKLTSMLISYVEQNGLEFCFGEDEIFPVEIFSDFGCLPLFLFESKEIYEKLYNNLFTAEELMESFGKKIKTPSADELLVEQQYLDKKSKEKLFPLIFEQEENDTYFGFLPKLDSNVESDFLMLAHFALHSVEEYVKKFEMNKSLLINGKIPLDSLYDKMVTKINTKQINVVPSLKVVSLDNNSNNNVKSGGISE